MALPNLDWTLEYYEEHLDECNSLLKSMDNYKRIPLFNLSSLQNFSDGALVRYEGMVQDMCNPEFYPSSFTVINSVKNEIYTRSGKYRDITHKKPGEIIKLFENEFIPQERLVFFCTPLPGINKWVHDYKKKDINVKQEVQIPSGIKREACSLDEEMETENTCQESSASHTKKIRTDSSENKTDIQPTIFSNTKYFPIAEENGLPCVAKIYEEAENCKIYLNDAVEILGFVDLNPALQANGEDTDAEDKALHPPPSLVPTIHVILIRRLYHFNPLLKRIISYDDILPTVESARSDLHLILTQLLFEDTIAADYLLCHLLSRVYLRNDNHVIGKFSLNLFNINLPSFASNLHDVLKMLVTNSHFITLSTHFLNTTSFIPKKDYETNRLWSGLLQLCEDFLLIIDETTMNEGQLNNTGCLNLIALQRMFRDQEVQYDFGYYPITYNTNAQLLVVSEGKSMFGTDVRLKLKVDYCTESSLNESFKAVCLYLNEEVANKLRIYLTSMRLRDFELSEAMIRKIGEDYVVMRQNDRRVNSSDLHTLLVLSRLLALSHGRTVLSPEDWTRALEMETERKARLE